MIAFPILLYAETHYRFKYFFSFLKKSEPEILVDAPHRIDPGRNLPIMLLVKDADQYPIELESAVVSLSRKGKILHREKIVPQQPIPIHSHFWWNLIDVCFENQLEDEFGLLTIDVEISFRRRGVTKRIRNNNHRTSSKRSLSVYRSRTPLPSFPGWIYGDTHTHSSYTEDQVEFGSPLKAGAALSKAMGLSFFCVTDHSYDLDDEIGNYLRNDPSLPKWRQLHDEVNEINSTDHGVTIVRGEEVSVENSDGRTVHLLLFGTRKFFPGSGDGAEQWLQTECEHTIPFVLQTKEPFVAAYAGHPTEEVPFLQRLLLGRGEWTKQDMSLPELNGIQIMNGEFSDSFRNGMDVWKWLLLRGEKKFIAAGNDAHGNFNRFVQIGIPFIAIREKESQLFGKMKTLVYSSTAEERIVTGLKSGKSVITSGPVVLIELETDTHQIGTIGESVSGSRFILKVKAKTTEEFGHFSMIRIIVGTVGKKEKVLFEQKHFTDPFSIHAITGWETLSMFSYIRAEALTSNGTGVDRNGFCFTNPIWISPE